MKILKSKGFGNHTTLTTFVNDNGITREDILSIIPESSTGDPVIYFYADSEIKEKERNIWGKLES